MINRDPIYFFSPNLKKESYLLEELRERIQSGNHYDFLFEVLNGSYSIESKFSFSILNDILNIGGLSWIVNEKVFVKWPDWGGVDGRQVTKFALEKSIDKEDPLMKDLKKEEWNSHKDLFFDSIDKNELLEIIGQSSFELKPLAESESIIFDICLKYWTMPVRSRPSRSKRFILWCINDEFKKGKKVVGILEIGDDAPISNHRDDMLGLTYPSFMKWFESGSTEDNKNRLCEIYKKFCKLEESLREDSFYLTSDILPHKKLQSYRSKIRSAQSFFDPKNWHSDNVNTESGIRKFKEAIKIIHDITLPRIHSEVTICGSIPPFNEIYGGKLMVTFLGHPLIQTALQSSESKILQMSFDLNKLNDILPNFGSLAITTKGLYSGHSPMYKNSVLAWRNGQIKFRHLGNTNGSTTSFISSRSVVFAKKLLQLRHNQLSNIWGSGGSLKQRILTRSCHEVGLDHNLPFAGISRPVYGCCYVSNIHEIIWCNDQPNWLYDDKETSVGYSDVCYEVWSKKWLNKVIKKPNKILGTLYQSIIHRISSE